ncbi:MAG: bifunctional [glutamate--ammonia ligase]-adenylyl-L-tyrosine phosphorylase/[glutamate--ammonia-ligase] adenylyltransferase [Betaproteobacteria bacterium]
MTGQHAPQKSDYSRFAQRIRRRYGRELELLAPGVPLRGEQDQVLATLRTQGHSLGDALRMTRQWVLERLLSLDCEQRLALQQVTQAMTDWAECALCAAYDHASAELQMTHGAPRSPAGALSQLCIVGMGKLGARELNVSSDIDLIYIYEHDGETDGSGQGRGRICNQEYFGKLARALYALIGETTAHGFVFRVDLALRPNGNSGPPALSLGALEEYLQTQGREWERFAWLKSRVVAPQSSVGCAFALQLRAAITPFVFRRYLDYNVFDALRVLHRQIRDHASKRSAGHPERSKDVKLSRGGIREIEFTVQLLQVVRGGQFPELRTRPTLSALTRLSASGLMPAATAQGLSQAYVFLRQLEHRIQYLDDQQTHVLPTESGDLAWIASTMGFGDTGAFLSQFDTHRELVAQEFDALLGGAPAVCAPCQRGPQGDGGSAHAGTPDLEALLLRLDGALQTRVAHWRTQARVQALRDESRARLFTLVQRTARWAREGSVSQDACVRWVDWIEPLLRRESYLALLVERPGVHERVLRVLGAARWPARYLQQHPGVIDELASSAMLDERFNPVDFAAELERRMAALRSSGEDDDEALLNILRRAHHAEVFRTLARDVEGRLTVEEVADDLSALADAVLRTTTAWCWARLKTRHTEVPQLAIIAYGKLGGKELGYGSDLDIVFVYDDPDERAGEIYGALVRKLINWLTVKTSEGDLYEIDTALRPNGNAGLLVTPMGAYANYQQQRGSNTAWTWEHQAMTRARCVLGSPAMQARFAAVREAVIASPRDIGGLHVEIAAMRAKVRAAHRDKDGLFDVKHSPGGMVDMEFAVQFLVLAHGANQPALRANAGNIALLQRAQDCGLLHAPVGTDAAQAYRSLRHLQHRARLNEEPTEVATHAVAQERAAGLALWEVVFGMTG